VRRLVKNSSGLFLKNVQGPGNPGQRKYYSHSSLSFFFLLVHFEFGFEIYRDCENTSCEHLQICFNIFCHLEFEIFELVAW
jgi:hypothetical protein